MFDLDQIDLLAPPDQQPRRPFKVGDRVRVVMNGQHLSQTDEFDNLWVTGDMCDRVNDGVVYQVIRAETWSGVKINDPDHYSYPAACLELVS